MEERKKRLSPSLFKPTPCGYWGHTLWGLQQSPQGGELEKGVGPKMGMSTRRMVHHGELMREEAKLQGKRKRWREKSGKKRAPLSLHCAHRTRCGREEVKEDGGGGCAAGGGGY